MNPKSRVILDEEGVTVEELSPDPTPKSSTEILAERADGLEADLLSGSQILDLPPVRWLVRDWIPRSAVTEVYAPPGAGKSFFSLSLALQVARGGQWLGNRFQRPEKVLYIAPEAQSEHRDRIEAWQLDTGDKAPAEFLFLPTRVNIFRAEELEVLEEVVKRRGPFGLIVVDTLAASTPGMKENAVEDMTVVTANLDRLRQAAGNGCALVIVHHTGKDLTRGARGSSALEGFVRATIQVTVTPETGYRKAEVGKSSAAMKPLPVFFRIESVTLDPHPDDEERRPREVGILRESDWFTATDDAESAFLKTLHEYRRPGEEFTKKEAKDLAGVTEKVAEKRLTALAKRGEIERVGKGPKTRWRLTGTERPTQEKLENTGLFD